jgi:hypothetical protein
MEVSSCARTVVGGVCLVYLEVVLNSRREVPTAAT